ncbi:hypothetical protein [Intestinimonas sp. MSJ-38]|uniref:hypothetical protein n=1 Tax=Intestinimonas sp. MSJ-38 TaxID=2841532 RepID=UPI001C1144D6|nr:hypothetical protein [Intestinimonas sp. MSJ-38]MBU5431822.1 hypothetical protein [Intestinimonas sp. MSJ-38]
MPSEKCRIAAAGQHSAPNSSLVKTARPFWTAHTGIALDLVAPQIFARRFAAVIDITAVWIRLAGGMALPYNFCWWFFETRLIGKLFIQRIEIALHTLFNFCFYIDPAFS